MDMQFSSEVANAFLLLFVYSSMDDDQDDEAIS